MRSKLFALALVLVAGAALATAYVADIQGGTQFKQSSIGTTPALCGTFLGTTSYQVCLAAAVSSAAWNPIVVANDSVLVFNAGAISTGALDIVPHSSSSVGLRMTNSGSTFSGALTSNGSVLFAGGATASGSTAFNLSGSSAAFSTPTGANTFGGSSNVFSHDIQLSAVTTYVYGNGTGHTTFFEGGTDSTSIVYLRNFDTSGTNEVEVSSAGVFLAGLTEIAAAAKFDTSVQVNGGTVITSSYHGTCTLIGASPSVCTATVASTSTCGATARGATAASASAEAGPG